ncbi:unnamed protein product [Microthlaspi erraticum]|uniref:RNase H type-1 domain-containing protein n=1 Tax=Microthlaspi erraticum TaxID=1685480 RepID=A0A6D2JVY3_9BRAS|nr:unnamed protein product [Microthlaspi erraticum]
MTWRANVLDQLFTTEEIRCIKPNRLTQMDSFVWAFTKSGTYSVKSGYALASQLKEDRESPQNDTVAHNASALDAKQHQKQIGNMELAQLVEKTVSDNVISSPVVQTDSIITASQCQTDASWSRECNVFGGGFVLETVNNERLFGAMAEYQVSTPLHAELAALVWAMKKALELDITSLSFETDCLQLVRIVDNEEDWPSMTSELDELHTIRSSFTLFSLSFIPRLLNVRADRLSKGARAQGFCFTHVDPMIPSWLVLETNSAG